MPWREKLGRRPIGRQVIVSSKSSVRLKNAEGPATAGPSGANLTKLTRDALVGGVDDLGPEPGELVEPGASFLVAGFELGAELVLGETAVG